ncbi:calcyphosin-like protein [Centruroides sculpturatus]|uniref:calcyphosin-like protein n=1 Tax=Centruroides sculpturatus TaxID=218467 RepID=UPI000C6D1EF1|nr:calcyphosin-like protein [Centruroides sculpturatus]
MPRPVSAQTRNENVMKQCATRKLAMVVDPVEKLRLLCLQRGSKGILGMGRVFRRMDDNRSGDLNEEEFKKGLMETGMGSSLSPEEIEELFKQFDCDGSGSLNYEEFIRSVRPRMSPQRLALVEKAFAKLDKTGDGKITFEDLQGVYNVKNHPQYLNGQITEKDLLRKFLANFEEGGVIDGTVTKEEFINYYTGVSASIDDDAYFDLMMRTSWKL